MYDLEWPLSEIQGHWFFKCRKMTKYRWYGQVSCIFSSLSLLPPCLLYGTTQKTRSAWQSQTWGRPAPQVRVPNKFQEDEIPLAVMAGRMKKFSENTSTIPEVMESSTLKLKANFKFSRFFFWGGETPVPLRVCASKPLSISRVCIIWGGSTP